MKNSDKNQTVAELQNEYSQKLQHERRIKSQEKYRILCTLFEQVHRLNTYTPVESNPISKKNLNLWQKWCQIFLNFLLNHKEK